MFEELHSDFFSLSWLLQAKEDYLFPARLLCSSSPLCLWSHQRTACCNIINWVPSRISEFYIAFSFPAQLHNTQFLNINLNLNDTRLTCITRNTNNLKIGEFLFKCSVSSRLDSWRLLWCVRALEENDGGGTAWCLQMLDANNQITRLISIACQKLTF